MRDEWSAAGDGASDSVASTNWVDFVSAYLWAWAVTIKPKLIGDRMATKSDALQLTSHCDVYEMKSNERRSSQLWTQFMQLREEAWTPPGAHSLIWAIRGRVAGQGMIFFLAVLDRVFNLTCLCPKQGMVSRAERLQLRPWAVSFFSSHARS